MNVPLAERLRPKVLEDYIGQEHLVGEGAPLQQMLKTGYVSSFILWGPPGVGKTTLAQILANTLGRNFFQLSAIQSGVKDVRAVIDKAKKQRFFNTPSPILFIDEIHRFSKSQQDALLGAVEQGYITLIGATTENPSFEVIPALRSRCQVYILKSLDEKALDKLIARTLEKDEYFKDKNIQIKERNALYRYSGGDGRKLLNILDLLIGNSLGEDTITITDELVVKALQSNPSAYDKKGELHYDIISAFIKSIRGSDPNAALYWLARMIDGGEDVEFIARRLIISAAEDIGLANPNALLMATTCFDAVRRVGFPESRIILSQATIYLATSAKSNAAYLAIGEALDTVKKTGNLSVPLPLRNAPSKLMKDLNYGKDYLYAHNYPGNFVAQEFMPDELSKTTFYKAQQNPQEQQIKKRMRQWWGDKYD